MKAKALLDYKLCELIIRCDEKPIVVKYCYWTTFLVPKQSQKDEQLDKSDNEKSDKEEKKQEQKETAKLVYTTFTSNGKTLDNIKANKKKIIVNNKMICWPYYDMLQRTFD
ncbi:hypothetical protein G9A89_008233 [Geosiphon pyriformis]|nr:hypothetical protein G9A89_008233 [Geosiphon pyriformis]